MQGSGQSFLSIDSTGRHTPPKPLTPSVCMLFCKHLCASASWPDNNRTCHHLLRASRNGAGTIAATSSSPTELLGSSYHLHHPIPSPGPPRAIWKLCIVFFGRSPPVTPPELGSTHYEIPQPRTSLDRCSAPPGCPKIICVGPWAKPCKAEQR